MHFETHNNLNCYTLNLNPERNDETIELLKMKHHCTVIFFSTQKPPLYTLVSALRGVGGMDVRHRPFVHRHWTAAGQSPIV